MEDEERREKRQSRFSRRTHGSSIFFALTTLLAMTINWLYEVPFSALVAR
jgi:hypothetical protein